jgi:hypothetical protein
VIAFQWRHCLLPDGTARSKTLRVLELTHEASGLTGQKAYDYADENNGQSSLLRPRWITAGDEVIKRENTDHKAALIPGAGELILPGVSHFTLLQDSGQFNDALLHFLSRP